jgi:hypothetical protein
MTAAPTTSDADQQLADEIHQLMVAQGALFALDTPIRQSLANLAEFLAGRHKRDKATLATAIDAALSGDSRFAREEVGGEVRFVTSRQGAYVARNEVDTHSFKQRLHDPENPLPIDDISVVVSTSRPAITTVEPVFISDYWQIQAGIAPSEEEALIEAAHTALEPVAEPTAAPVEPVGEAEAQRLPEPAAEPVVAPVSEAEPVVAAEVVAPVEAEAPAAAVSEAEAQRLPAPAAEPAAAAPVAASEAEAQRAPAPAAPAPAKPAPRPAIERSTIFTLPDGTAIDLRRGVPALLEEHGEQLAALLAEKIEQDPLRRMVSFGRKYYPEVAVASLGKNDLRKIRDYIMERGEPLLDTELIADLYYHNPNKADYEGFRFSLNYRLHREKDFEFVGVEGAHLWSTKGLPAIGGKRVKAAEMGQITSYLLEGYDDSLKEQSAEAIRESGSVTRMLTFFEWEYGVLPLDASLAALLPGPVLPEQRSAVLRFESPQHYSSYPVEVRYPAGNRGGWLHGLEEFFREHLVPGAMITIARTGEPHLFQISYEEAAEASDRILTLDEKKNKLGFANLTYYSAVDEDQVPSQAKYPRLNRLKSFPMGERRKAELMLEHVAETMGEQVGTRSEPRYAITMDDLLMGFNVLRPGSRALLSHLLEHGEDFSADESTPGLFVYAPAPSDSEAEPEQEGEELLEDVQPTRRRRGGRYDEDE